MQASVDQMNQSLQSNHSSIQQLVSEYSQQTTDSHSALLQQQRTTHQTKIEGRIDQFLEESTLTMRSLRDLIGSQQSEVWHYLLLSFIRSIYQIEIY